jgi:hypothetical protein
MCVCVCVWEGGREEEAMSQCYCIFICVYTKVSACLKEWEKERKIMYVYECVH